MDLHSQLIRLGDMMGDGMHEEPGGEWIEKEYGRVAKILYPDMFPKKNYTNRNQAVAKWCSKNKCFECSGSLKQTRSGSLRVICEKCGAKFQLSRK